MAKDKQNKILETKLLIYECEGTESEIKEWFKTINIAGVPLNDQELLNAVYSGPFVTLGKEEFSNSQNANIQKWSAYVSGSANRQDFLECALDWVSKGNIGDYMSNHRKDKNINELKKYFNSVIDWVSSVFTDVESEMRGLEWGRLYEEYHKKAIIPQRYQPKCKSFTVIRISKIAKVFLNIFLAVQLIRNYLMFESLMRQLKNLFTADNKPQKLKQKQIKLSALRHWA